MFFSWYLCRKFTPVESESFVFEGRGRLRVDSPLMSKRTELRSDVKSFVFLGMVEKKNLKCMTLFILKVFVYYYH